MRAHHRKRRVALASLLPELPSSIQAAPVPHPCWGGVEQMWIASFSNSSLGSSLEPLTFALKEARASGQNIGKVPTLFVKAGIRELPLSHDQAS